MAGTITPDRSEYRRSDAVQYTVYGIVSGVEPAEDGLDQNAVDKDVKEQFYQRDEGENDNLQHIGCTQPHTNRAYIIAESCQLEDQQLEKYQNDAQNQSGDIRACKTGHYPAQWVSVEGWLP